MNKVNSQIQSLLDQARTSTSSIDDIFEKFAKLIVNDCISVVRNEYASVHTDESLMDDEYWKGYVSCGVDSIVAIRQHFFSSEPASS